MADNWYDVVVVGGGGDGTMLPMTMNFKVAKVDRAAVNCKRMQGWNPTDPLDCSRAEMLGRGQVQQVLAVHKKHAPGFERAILLDTPAPIGERESRHPQGVCVLQADDLLPERECPDPMLQASYPIDCHSPSGAGAERRFVCSDGAYPIPLRCLLAGQPRNLVLAGRAISALQEAAASHRRRGRWVRRPARWPRMATRPQCRMRGCGND